jgi:hypothetical protein
MKIVNLTQFLALPNETLFCKYQPCAFGELEIKVENAGQIDFVTQDLAGAIAFSDSGEFLDKLEDARENGISLPMDFDFAGRDGLFEKDQLFAVYESADVEALIARLQRCLPH